jgi:hypothetical protein
MKKAKKAASVPLGDVESLVLEYGPGFLLYLTWHQAIEIARLGRQSGTGWSTRGEVVQDWHGLTGYEQLGWRKLAANMKLDDIVEISLKMSEDFKGEAR